MARGLSIGLLGAWCVGSFLLWAQTDAADWAVVVVWVGFTILFTTAVWAHHGRGIALAAAAVGCVGVPLALLQHDVAFLMVGSALDLVGVWLSNPYARGGIPRDPVSAVLRILAARRGRP